MVTRTLTAPAACAGAVTVIEVAVFAVRPVAAVPPKVTPVAPVKFVPVIVTDGAPPSVEPVFGLIDVTVGNVCVYVNAGVEHGDTLPTASVAVP